MIATDSKEFAQALAERERRECDPRHADYCDSYALGGMTIYFAFLLDHLEAVLARKQGASKAARREIKRLKALAFQHEGDSTGAGTPAESGNQSHEQRNESPEGMKPSPEASGNAGEVES